MWTSFVSWIGSILEALTLANAGSLGLAIVILSLAVRLSLVPISIYVGRRTVIQGRKMARLKPRLDKLKVKYKSDPAKLQKETMALFKKEGVSPVDGKSMLVTFLQTPIFMAVYSAIRNGLANSSSSFLWIKNLAKADLYLAMLVGLLTYCMMSLVPEMPEASKTMMIFLQVIISVVFVSQIASGVGVYWAAGSLVGIIDKLLLRLSLKLWPVGEPMPATMAVSAE